MSRQQLLLVGVALVLSILFLGGCGVNASTAVLDTPTTSAAPEQVPATSTPKPATSTSAASPATSTPEPPTATPTPEPPPATEEVVSAIGDPDRGRQIFENGGEKYTDAKTGHISSTYICISCHSLDGSEGPVHSPSLQGISERAGHRVPGLSAADYIRQSILEPDAYVVEGTKYRMGRFPSILLTEAEVDDLVAFLLTQ